MLSSLERALTHPEKLSIVPPSSPTRSISSSFLQKAYSEAYNLLHVCTSGLQGPRGSAGCASFPIPKTRQCLGVPYERKEKKKVDYRRYLSAQPGISSRQG